MSTVAAFFALYAPWFWVIVAVVCALIEGATCGLTTVWFAVSAVLMALISLLHFPFVMQCILFSLVSLLLLLFTRPIAINLLRAKRVRTNADSLIGKKAQVIRPISEWSKGQVKINGAVWTAALAGTADMPKGSECIVDRIEGVTLIVKEYESAE